MDKLQTAFDSLTIADDIDGGNEKQYNILSVDVGIKHLGLSMAIFNEEFILREIVWFELIDITVFLHNVVHAEQCTLYHEQTASDWMDHVYQENIELFNLADYILIERQPPMGQVVIEQLIFSRWRHKSHLVHPKSMHTWYNIADLEYDLRKKYTIEIAMNYITNPTLIEMLDSYERKHDISDSIVLMLYWTAQQHIEYVKQKQKDTLKATKMLKVGKDISIDAWFELHRYVPPLAR
jgi:hypothetical protein